MSGGAGYLLSRTSFEAIVNGLLNGDLAGIASSSSLPEDVAVGVSMAFLGVDFVSGIDDDNRIMFSPIKMSHHRNGKAERWYTDMTRQVEMVKGGSSSSQHQQQMPTCCSERMISMHYVTPSEMLQGHFLLRGRGGQG